MKKPTYRAVYVKQEVSAQQTGALVVALDRLDGNPFLRITKFSLLPRRPDEAHIDVLNEMLTKTFA